MLLLNPDARVEPDAIRLLVDAARRHPEAVGFSPKILLADPGVAIDSVGLSLLPNGIGVQRGLGQADAGQYDSEEAVPGLCFAASLVRGRAFQADSVGPLDHRYFMYYEDVDWSLRAQVLGESFWTVPGAVVYHFHSASTRHLGGGFKTRLIQRNLMWTAVKDLEPGVALRVLLRRTARNLERLLVRQQPAAARAIWEAWAGMPGMLRSRRQLQRRRRRRDRDFVVKYPEHTFFDAETYRPEISVAALVAVLSRLHLVDENPFVESALEAAERAQAAGQVPALVAAAVRASRLPLTPGLEWLLSSLEALSP